MNRTLRTVLYVLAALALLVALLLGNWSDDAEAAECYPVAPETVRVIDGDSVEMLGEKWRLTLPDNAGGFDTPETFRPKCYAEELLGKKATERLQQLVDGGELVACTDGERGRYGRLLVWLSAQGQDVGETLMAEGLAQPWPRVREWCGDE